MDSYKKLMDELLQKEIAEGRVKGASALVLYKGKEIYADAFGYADAERGLPMRRDTIIRLFSMSKPITAAAVMMLVERGKLDVWDKVSEYLPAFRHTTVWDEKLGEIAMEREITIWDLLNMTSGICYPDIIDEPGRRMDKVIRELIARREQGEWVDTQEYARRIAQVPLCFQPGDRWKYGFSADILGAVVEVVTGERFGSFLQKELFTPLEMPDTGFYIPEAKKDRFAQYYEEQPQGGLKVHTGSHLGEYCGEDVAFESGGAGLLSTLDDYSHFATMLTHKGNYQGKQLIGRKTVEFMTKNQLTEYQRRSMAWDSTKGYGYGCLMRVLIDAAAAGTNASLGEYGWDGWTGNYVTMDASEDLVFLYFMQRCGAGMTPVVRKLRAVTYGALDNKI